uniref:Transmembrane serine protease 7 n=1 Tax=Astyanax mexicanus TaxID=7994 RepID=A0A8B9K1I4_ASTMX
MINEVIILFLVYLCVGDNAICCIDHFALFLLLTVQRESNSGVYFAGMFCVANVEFIPEYRHADSSEFVSMANQIQQVISNVYRSSSVSRLYKHTIITDLSNNDKGGVLVHFWMIFIVPRLKTPSVCEECVNAIFRDSVLTSLKNRSSVGFLLGLPVDIDSIFINAALRTDYTSTSTGSECVDKLYAGLPEVKVPLNVFSSWGGLSCHIKLTSAPGTIIRLTVNSLDIEPTDCIYDAITVYDSLLPMRIKTLHRSVTATRSFSAGVAYNLSNGGASLPCSTNLWSEIYKVLETQKITSPFYPSLLPPLCSCTWRLKTTSSAFGVALKFQNYILSPKDLIPCEHGWWKVNENIYCGTYVSHMTVFRIPEASVEVVFRCSSRNAEQPFSATYSSFNISQPCPEGHFLCTTGLCVEKERRCDGLDDCQDESDEVYCCMSTFLISEQTKDIPLNTEMEQLENKTSCSGIRYQCSSGTCILKKNAKCDGVFDCLDHSDEKDCGKFHERVVGGVNSVEGEWPWQVSLYFAGHLYCGASVISSEWLVSAAHCFSRESLSDARQWMAYLGMLAQGSAKHVAEIRRIVVHEYYNARTFDYDIALLQLRKAWPSNLASFIQPVCLPSASLTLSDGHRCWVTGWGYRSEQDKVLPTVLQKAEVNIMSQSECKRTYGPVSPRMLCAGVPSGEQDACRGDSGGPLACQVSVGGRWFLTGIVSWGSGCGRPNFPGVYTRVAKFIDWINSHTNN